MKSLRIVVVCFALVVVFAFAAAGAIAETAGVGRSDSVETVETPGEEAERVEREERERREREEWERLEGPPRGPGPIQCECPDPDGERIFIEEQRRREARELEEAEALRNPPQATVPAPPTAGPPAEAPGPPETGIARHPSRVTSKRRATFAFTANQTPAAFECGLDGASFQPCGGVFTTKKLRAPGRHILEVRAANSAGEVDGTPASYSWRVTARRPRSHR